MLTAENNIGTKFKKALVTGGAGFIGSHLVDSLLDDGLQVVSLDDYTSGKLENLTEAREYKESFAAYECDVSDISDLEKYFEGVDIVFNIAASKMTVCLEDPKKDLDVNAGGALNIMLLARKYGVKKVIHASTGSVYGEPKVFPTTETHPFNPKSYYGVSKLAGERYVNAFFELYAMNTTILRFYHVYGPRQDSSDLGGVTSIFCRNVLDGKTIKIFGDGSQIRSLTYVKDVIEIAKLTAVDERCRGEAYNCASGSQITILDLAKSIIDILGVKDAPIEFFDWRVGDIPYFDVSNEKLKNIGFDFKYRFDDGLRETVNWHVTKKNMHNV